MVMMRTDGEGGSEIVVGAGMGITTMQFNEVLTICPALFQALRM